jgi:ATP-dependent DNA ligase
VYSYKVMMAGEGSHTFLRRRKRLRNIVGEVDCHRLRLTQYTRITTQKQFETIRENCCAYRGFGVILRRDTPYEAGKTGNILRVPPLEDDK